MANKYGENDTGFEDVSSYSSPKEYQKRKKNRRGRTVLKSIFGFFCVLLIVVGAGMVYLSTDLVAGLSTKAITKDKDELGIKDTATVDNSIKNIALFGVDARDDTFTGLSDAIIILTIDNKHKKIKMTSIMRDSRVDYMGDYGANKINAAYKYGGFLLAIKTLNQNFNLNIEDYVTVNFNRLAEIVDAFGGVRISLTDEEAYWANDNVNALMYEQIHDGYERTIWEDDLFPVDEDGYIRGGEDMLLNGNQAVGYARIREDSDNIRVDRQKKVMIALMERLMEVPVSDYYTIAQSMMDKCETSFGLNDILAMVPAVMNGINIETLTIPGDQEYPEGKDFDDGLGWVWRYDMELAAQHIDRFIYEEGSQFYDPAEGNGADFLSSEPEDE